MTTAAERPALSLVKDSAAADTHPEPKVIEGTVNPGTTTLTEDLAGDIPLIPEWVKTTEGWKTRGRIASRQTARNSRHWLRRQRTEHGYLPMIGRGIAHVYRWTAGSEGAVVHAARLDARIQAEEAKRAAWKYRTKAIPGKEKDRLLAVATQQKNEAISANNVLAKTRAAARRAIAVRSLVSLAMPAAGITASGIYGGSVGLAGASMALLTGLGLLGRHTGSDDLWDEPHTKVGDGDPMTESMLNRVYTDAKVIGPDVELKLITPPMLTADGSAWEVIFDLPSGMPTKNATSKTAGLANALGVTVPQIHQEQVGREGRLRLRVSLTVPFTGSAPKGPLLEAERVNLWRAIPMGIDLRGGMVTTCWVERSGLFGGEPGAGKSAAANNVLLAAALDPTVRLYLADGKAGADITPFEGIAAMYDTDGDPERLLEILKHIWTVEVPERRSLAKEHGSRKLTEEMAAKDPRVCLAVLYIDEWASYGAAAERKIRDEIERLLRLIVQQGRALGIITLTGTQKPDSEAVPTGIRDILSIRWAMRCLTPEASDTILGKGRASAGYNAQGIIKSQRGVGYFMSGETAEPELVRGHYYDDAEVDRIVAVAMALREAAGTLPAGPEPTILDHMIKAASATGRGNVTRGELFAYLAGVDAEYVRREVESDSAYASRAGSALKAQLAELGVDLPATQFPHEGRRVWGWALDALQGAG